MLDDIGVTQTDFEKCRTCLTRMILKTHSICCLRKVIILDLYRLVIFTFCYYLVPPTWKVVVNSIYPPVFSIINTRKGVCIYKYIVYLRYYLSSVAQLGTPVVRLIICKFSWVHLGYTPECRY